MPKLTSIEIKRNPDYASVKPGQLVGLVTITDEGEGQHTISLTAATLIKILAIIKTDVVQKMAEAQRSVPAALNESLSIFTHIVGRALGLTSDEIFEEARPHVQRLKESFHGE
jgi:hypothetical protein